jgi:hypothetical protein
LQGEEPSGWALMWLGNPSHFGSSIYKNAEINSMDRFTKFPKS